MTAGRKGAPRRVRGATPRLVTLRAAKAEREAVRQLEEARANLTAAMRAEVERGMTVADVARHVGIARQNVHERLRRAR